MKQTYPTILALAAAISALETNKFLIYKDPTTVGDETRVPNRQIMRELLDSGAVVTEQHIKTAEETVVYLQQVEIMQTLTTGHANSFLKRIVELVSNETVKSNELGLMAWTPKLERDLRTRDTVREISAQYESHSKYVGKIKDKIVVDFTMIDKRYFKDTDSWSVYGYDSDNNLISYWANKEEKICDSGRIQGRVKNHAQDRYRNNAKVTALNFVKVL